MQTSHRKRLRQLTSQAREQPPGFPLSRWALLLLSPPGRQSPAVYTQGNTCLVLPLQFSPSQDLYLSVTSTKPRTDAFLHLSALLPRECSVFLSTQLCSLHHGQHTELFSFPPPAPPAQTCTLPHGRELVGAGSHGTPALWATLISLRFKRD